MAVANFNGDDLTILRNAGGGNLLEPATSPEETGTSPRSIALGDFDGDGDIDLATANTNSGDVTVLKNR